MKSNKVFTKTGDSGFTSLNSGKRVPKHDIRIKAYGTIDELIAWLGLIRGITSTTDIKTTLLEIQKQLMTIAAEFSIESKKDLLKNLIPIQPIDVKHIENKIDILTAKLPPLKDFLIPGGHVLISYSHLARCVCRRA
jgi:cob(I)alamin adenosyltransferase